MKMTLELNATCENCKHWHFMTEDEMDFLEDDECYCILTNEKKNPKDECEKLELEICSIQVSELKINKIINEVEKDESYEKFKEKYYESL